MNSGLKCRSNRVGVDSTNPEFHLRSPGGQTESSDPELIKLIRQLNPVIRVSAGMLTGYGRPAADRARPVMVPDHCPLREFQPG